MELGAGRFQRTAPANVLSQSSSTTDYEECSCTLSTRPRCGGPVVTILFQGDFMKIAQVVHLGVSIPPEKYGGTERVVSSLTEELVRLGHDVTLFASGDSITRAKLVPMCERALTHAPFVNRDALVVHMLEHVS